jgi:hypothetical protein
MLGLEKDIKENIVFDTKIKMTSYGNIRITDSRGDVINQELGSTFGISANIKYIF